MDQRPAPLRVVRRNLPRSGQAVRRAHAGHAHHRSCRDNRLCSGGATCTGISSIAFENADSWGAPYVHGSSTHCHYQSSRAASCDAIPVDGQHVRLCACRERPPRRHRHQRRQYRPLPPACHHQRCHPCHPSRHRARHRWDRCPARRRRRPTPTRRHRPSRRRRPRPCRAHPHPRCRPRPRRPQPHPQRSPAPCLRACAGTTRSPRTRQAHPHPRPRHPRNRRLRSLLRRRRPRPRRHRCAHPLRLTTTSASTPAAGTRLAATARWPRSCTTTTSTATTGATARSSPPAPTAPIAPTAVRDQPHACTRPGELKTLAQRAAGSGTTRTRRVNGSTPTPMALWTAIASSRFTTSPVIMRRTLRSISDA